jgi:hypothetical protein
VLYPETVRGALGAAPGALAADALAPRRWPELLLPHLLGEPLGDGESGFWAAASFPWQRYYPVVFAGAALLLTLPFVRLRRSGLRPFAWLAVSGLAGAALLGIPAVADLARQLPGLGSLRFGIKLLVLVAVALPPLVATGSVRLRERWPIAGRRLCLGLLLAVVALAPLAVWPSRLPAAAHDGYPSAPALANAPTPRCAGSRRRSAALAVPPATCVLAGGGSSAGDRDTGGQLLLGPPLDEAAGNREPPAVAALPRTGARRVRPHGHA